MVTSDSDIKSIWYPRLVKDYTFIMTKPNPNDFTTCIKNFLKDTPRAADVSTSDESFLDRKEFIIMAQKLVYLYTDLIYPPTNNTLIPNTPYTVAQFNVIYRKNIEAFLDAIDLKIYQLVTLGEGQTNKVQTWQEAKALDAWVFPNLRDFIDSRPPENLVINRIKYFIETTFRADDCRTNDNSYVFRRGLIKMARNYWNIFCLSKYFKGVPSDIPTGGYGAEIIDFGYYINRDKALLDDQNRFGSFLDLIDLDIYQSTLIAEAKYRAESDDSFLGIIPRKDVINLLTNVTYAGTAILFATVAVEAGAAIAASSAAQASAAASAEAAAVTAAETGVYATTGELVTAGQAVEGSTVIGTITDFVAAKGGEIATAVVASQLTKEVNNVINPPKTVQRPVPQIVANPQIAVDNTQKKSISPYVLGGGALMLILGALS